MRVCHLTSVHSPADNRIFYKECQSLLKAGYEVVLLARGSEDSTVSGIRIVAVRVPSSRILRMSVGAVRMLICALKQNAGIYHFHDPELMPVGVLLRLLGKTVVADVHENTPAAVLSKPYLKKPGIAKLVSRLIDVAEHVMLYPVNAVFTARPDISHRLTKFNPVTLHNFPDVPNIDSIERAAVGSGKAGVIYVGGISRIRGIIPLIRAFEHLETAELWLLGPFESEAFRKECESLPGWKNTRYLGVTDPKGVFAYLKAASIGIITFLPYPNHVTTLATKPFEYMAAGLPMVMSDFPYWRDFFGSSALYADPSNPIDIAAKVQELVSDAARRRAMGDKNRLLARTTYTWDAEARKLIEKYGELLTGRDPREAA